MWQKDYGKDTLRPVTIKQLNDAQQESDRDFKIDGADITQVSLLHPHWCLSLSLSNGRPQVTFVAQIRNISSQSLNITYKLDDGTGSLEVKQWVDSDVAMNSNPNDTVKLQENQYVRVWGKLNSYKGKRHLGSHALRPITDYNEISYHLLEATAVHLFFTRGPPGQGKAQQNGANGDYAAGQDSANGGGALGAATSATARKVYEVIRTSPQSNEGLHMSDIASRLGLQSGDVLKAGDELLTMGVIYTTVDDHTWALLNM